MHRQSTIVATGANPSLFGPTLGEISSVIERRLSRHGRSSMTLDAVELKDGKAVVIHLSNATNTVFREVIDALTGRLIKREVLRPDPLGRMSTVCRARG